MKDVNTLAKELGVTRQTIYRRIKDLDPEHIVIKDKKTYILPPGEAILKDLSPETHRIDPAGQYVSDKYIKTLEEQLKVKDKQIEDLTRLTDNLSSRLQETSYLLAQKQQLELMPPEKEEVTSNVTAVTTDKAPLLKRLKKLIKR